MPAEDYGFKPTPDERSVGRIADLLAGAEPLADARGRHGSR